MKKRILAAILLCAVLASSLASCSETSTANTDNTSEDTEVSTETVVTEETASEETASESDALISIEDNYDWKADVNQTDYSGYEYHILNGCTASWYQYNTVIAEELTGEPVNDAVYTRQSRVEDYLNIKVSEVVNSDSHSALKAAVKAGTTDYDLALCTLMNDFATALAGNSYDLNTIDGMEAYMANSWFDQNSVNDLTVNGKLYFVTSDFDTTRFDSIRSLYFNKTLIEDNKLENPYDLVDNNQWTIDKFIEMCRAGEKDVDGDGVMTDADSYGYVTYTEIAVDLLMCGSNIKYLTKDPETGKIIDGTTGEEVINTYNKIYSLLYDSQCVFDVTQSRYSTYLRGLGDRMQETLFMEDKAIFYSECMAWTKALREMESDFGVVPPPKADESQDRYYSIIINPFMQMIPSCLSSEEAARSGDILNALAAASHDTVVDAYVNVTLQNKVTRDPDSVRMLHLVFDELSYNLNVSSADARGTITGAMKSEKAELSSAIAKMAKMVKKGLDKANTALFGEE